jgi:unsaturated rhamnogalacturonyl hydrolase
LDKKTYLPSALSGLKACIARIQPNGQVAHVSKGTALGRDLDFYKTIPRIPVPYGQSLVIVALVEWLKLEKA